MSNWFKRLFGGSDDSATSEGHEPTTAPGPTVAPAAEAETADEPAADAGDESA